MDKIAFKDVTERCGLTKSELAFVYGVTRQTIYNWMKGGSPTQNHIARLAEWYTKGLRAAIDRGVLPLPASLSKQARDERLRLVKAKLYEGTKPQ